MPRTSRGRAPNASAALPPQPLRTTGGGSGPRESVRADVSHANDAKRFTASSNKEEEEGLVISVERRVDTGVLQFLQSGLDELTLRFHDLVLLLVQCDWKRWWQFMGGHEQING